MIPIVDIRKEIRMIPISQNYRIIRTFDILIEEIERLRASENELYNQLQNLKDDLK